MPNFVPTFFQHLIPITTMTTQRPNDPMHAKHTTASIRTVPRPFHDASEQRHLHESDDQTPLQHIL